MSSSVRPSRRSVGRSVGWFHCHNFLTGLKVSLPMLLSEHLFLLNGVGPHLRENSNILINRGSKIIKCVMPITSQADHLKGVRVDFMEIKEYIYLPLFVPCGGMEFC